MEGPNARRCAKRADASIRPGRARPPPRPPPGATPPAAGPRPPRARAAAARRPPPRRPTPRDARPYSTFPRTVVWNIQGRSWTMTARRRSRRSAVRDRPTGSPQRRTSPDVGGSRGAGGARRAAEVRAKGVTALRHHLEAAKGRHIRVLVENEARGRSADFTPVRLEACAASAGALVDAVVSGDDGASLLAEVGR